MTWMSGSKMSDHEAVYASCDVLHDHVGTCAMTPTTCNLCPAVGTAIAPPSQMMAPFSMLHLQRTGYVRPLLFVSWRLHAARFPPPSQLPTGPALFSSLPLMNIAVSLY